MDNIKKIIKIHKVPIGITIIGILLIAIIGATYAYYAYNMEDNNTITGNASTTNLSLTVTRIIPTTDEEDDKTMVPLLDTALYNAINGVGGNKSCVDSNGNLSCKIYRIVITNNSSNNVKVRGIVNLQASGNGSVFSSLKWTEITSPSQTKTGSSINGVGESVLEENLLLHKNISQTYYIAIWISETNSDQKTTDKGDFEGIVSFNAGGDEKGVTANFGGYESMAK